MQRKAPVLILTCNRQNKLEQLIDSLSACELSYETELYISVDYPPSDIYMDGWKNVCSYLDSLTRKNSCFQRVNIFRHERNIGVEASLFYMEKIVREKYDYAIITEDDNVFAPNALKYFNIYLNKYYNDKGVAFVSGYNGYSLAKETEAYLDAYGEFWGYGIWFEKLDVMRKWISWNNINQYAKSFKNIIRLKNEMPEVLGFLINSILSEKKPPFVKESGEIAECDVFYELYLMANDLLSVFPSKNLIYNDGFDGSGVNCDKNINRVCPICGQDIEFDGINDLPLIYNHVNIHNTQSLCTTVKLLIKWVIWRYKYVFVQSFDATRGEKV